MLLVNMEERFIGNMVHYLESVDLYLKSDENALNITSDALNLVSFIKKELKNIEKKGKVLDIGAGIGTLTFLLYKQNNFKEFYAIEIQEKVYKLLKENIENNKLYNIYPYNLDVKCIEKIFEKESFDFVISNPPFYKLNSGFLPKNEILRKSKFEECLTLKELFEKVSYILKEKSDFFLILPIEREKELLSYKNFKLINKEKYINSKKTFVAYHLVKM